MEYKYLSWGIVIILLYFNIFGWTGGIFILCGSMATILGIFAILFLHHDDLDTYFNDQCRGVINDPLNNRQYRQLRLNLDYDRKPILMILPNVNEQTERKKSSNKQNLITSSTNNANNTLSPSQHLSDERIPRKKSLIDSSIGLLFKKSSKSIKDGVHHHQQNSNNHNSSTKILLENSKDDRFGDTSAVSGNGGGNNYFHSMYDSIKIHTDRRKSHDGSISKHRISDISIGEDCFLFSGGQTTMSSNTVNVTMTSYTQATISAATNATFPLAILTGANNILTMEQNESPKSNKKLTMISGNKQIDQLLHTIIDYIIRDFIDSWFNILSDNREFSELRTRNFIEESLQNISNRIKNTDWISLITTKLIEDVATHTRFYRLAKQRVKIMETTSTIVFKPPPPPHPTAVNDPTKDSKSQQRNMAGSAGGCGGTGIGGQTCGDQNYLQQPKLNHHKRNKSDTDLGWHLSGIPMANKFYMDKLDEKPTNLVGNSVKTTGSKNITNSREEKLVNAFFDIADSYRSECNDERELEKYLTNVMETLLYYTLPEDEFGCRPLRAFLTTLLANVICKSTLEKFSDPDFINLQIGLARSNETPGGEYFLKLIRQCSDLSELRACRQFITKVMDSKFNDSNSSLELNSLKYTQKLIDLRLSYLQNHKSEVTSKTDHHQRTNHPTDGGKTSTNTKTKQKTASNLPILTLDELLTKEIALSYYLDYLSIMNLQKYVIFYLTAIEWKISATRCILELQTNKGKNSRDEMLQTLRDKVGHIYKEYLLQSTTSTNCLQIDAGLVEALNIKITNKLIVPENTWFDSICKFVYEKLKNEDVFLNNFYQSSAYKKLLLELEFCGQTNDTLLLDLDSNLSCLNMNIDLSSMSSQSLMVFGGTGGGGGGGDSNSFNADNNSADFTPFEDDDEDDDDDGDDGEVYDYRNETINVDNKKQYLKDDGKLYLDVSSAGGSGGGGGGSANFKHSRSHSDCTGIVQNMSDIIVGPFNKSSGGVGGGHFVDNSNQSVSAILIHPLGPVTNNLNELSLQNNKNVDAIKRSPASASPSPVRTLPTTLTSSNATPPFPTLAPHFSMSESSTPSSISNSSSIVTDESPPVIIQQKKIYAKIINTAIICDGQYAVYAIQASVIEDNQQKSWHIYRRYSRFLELKKNLVKRYPNISRVPFPAKKTFQNTERSVLEHRMYVLNEFLRAICDRSEDNLEIHLIVRDFLEPDNTDRKLHGGTVVRTIDQIVNPIKSGMRTIKNMPDSLVGGISKILLGRSGAISNIASGSGSSSSGSGSSIKGPLAFIEMMPTVIDHSWEYPALTSALNLMDEVFDLQSRSQWLRRGIINRLLGAPWVSHAANKRIISVAKSLIEAEKLESVINSILNQTWPDGNLPKKVFQRDDNTKLRTKMAAKIALLSLLSDELKHVVGSETTRSGLLDFFEMLQNQKLNLRLLLVIFNHILTSIYQTDNLTKHVHDV